MEEDEAPRARAPRELPGLAGGQVTPLGGRLPVLVQEGRLAQERIGVARLSLEGAE